jgi:hypothetical protein
VRFRISYDRREGRGAMNGSLDATSVRHQYREDIGTTEDQKGATSCGMQIPHRDFYCSLNRLLRVLMSFVISMCFVCRSVVVM